MLRDPQIAERRFRFKTYEELESKLLPVLRNQVFHATTPDGYVGVLRDGFIASNVDRKFPMTCSQSEASYFRKKGCISLVDLRDISGTDLADALLKYNF